MTSNASYREWLKARQAGLVPAATGYINESLKDSVSANQSAIHTKTA